MRGSWRYCGGQDAAHLRKGLQQAAFPVAAAGHACAYCLGHRPVSYLQGCAGEILGGCRWCKCITKVMGHFWRSRKGQKICLRQIGCCPFVFLTDQSQLAKELQSNVVSRDQKVLPSDTYTLGWMQKRPSLYVSG